jgi:putative metallohydrolase (TIGR04338 family)
MRDNQRQRLYDAENVLHGRRVSAAATKHLVDTERHSWWAVTDKDKPRLDEHGQPILGINGEPVCGTKALKYPNIAACQAYVNEITEARWFQARWGQRGFAVQAGTGSHAYGNTITLSGIHRRSEAVILHEMAHCLTPWGKAPHGPEFAGILLTLVRNVMGPEHAKDLRASFSSGRVRATMASVPAPKRTVETRAQKAAKSKPKNLGDRLGLGTDSQRKVAASIIRAQVKDGLFGPSGCKPRAHALATARALEKGQG